MTVKSKTSGTKKKPAAKRKPKADILFKDDVKARVRKTHSCFKCGRTTDTDYEAQCRPCLRANHVE